MPDGTCHFVFFEGGQTFWTLNRQLENLCKGPHGKYFRISGPYGLCHYSTYLWQLKQLKTIYLYMSKLIMFRYSFIYKNR